MARFEGSFFFLGLISQLWVRYVLWECFKKHEPSKQQNQKMKQFESSFPNCKAARWASCSNKPHRLPFRFKLPSCVFFGSYGRIHGNGKPSLKLCFLPADAGLRVKEIKLIRAIRRQIKTQPTRRFPSATAASPRKKKGWTEENVSLFYVFLVYLGCISKLREDAVAEIW